MPGSCLCSSSSSRRIRLRPTTSWGSRPAGSRDACRRRDASRRRGSATAGAMSPSCSHPTCSAPSTRSGSRSARRAFRCSSTAVCAECDYDELNGAPVAQLDRRRHVDEPFPGGESYRDVVARTASLLRELLTQWDGARVCVVAHSANRWALEHLVHGAPLEQLVEAPFAWREGWEFAIERI